MAKNNKMHEINKHAVDDETFVFSNKTNSELDDMSESNSTSILNLPSEWLDLLKPIKLETKNFTDEEKKFKTKISTEQWLKKALEIYGKHVDNSNELMQDYFKNLSSIYFKFILKCCNTLGLFKL